MQDGRFVKKMDDAGLVEEIRLTVTDPTSHGNHRVWFILRRERERRGIPPLNANGMYQVMRAHGLLLQRRPSPRRPQRRHDGNVAVAKSNQRWCPDGFEFRCDNGEPLRVTFAPDCCDRESMSGTATTDGHSDDVVPDVMLAAVENRFGHALKAEAEIEWPTDNGSGYTANKTQSRASSSQRAAARFAKRIRTQHPFIH